jgi:hypothetical protein
MKVAWAAASRSPWVPRVLALSSVRTEASFAVSSWKKK